MSRAEDIFQKLIYFGEDALDDYIINRQAEELFLDFKQATPGIGKNVTSLPRDDRKNLAKCISGFGNSEGGVIIWGVECSRDYDIGDVAKAKIKVKNVHRFLSWLENAISGCTIPSHNKVRNHIISNVLLSFIGTVKRHFALYCENTAVILALRHVIMNCLDNHCRLLFLYYPDNITDELFRVILKQVKFVCLNTLQYFCHSTPG